MNKLAVISHLLSNALLQSPHKQSGTGFAPTNIALCKYWGKRDAELNLPITSSLSIALPNKGSTTTLTLIDQSIDRVIFNGRERSSTSPFVERLVQYLDLFRRERAWHLQVDITMNIPVAAGFASSAAGFASLVIALNDLFDWHASRQTLSILARLGSGSAARSLWMGFVEWQAGADPCGMDSYGMPLEKSWPDLCVGLLSLNNQPKPISSRRAMQQTVASSVLYESWPKQVSRDLVLLKQAIQDKNFPLLGSIAENNALSMHATMLSSMPPICYFLPETLEAMHRIWKLRAEGLALYFTEDAGPNLKLLFLKSDIKRVQIHFPEMLLAADGSQADPAIDARG
ncbi:MAG: diphosphomevalonate decarboxylase [Gammaproteobacteria bacterium RIFCSPHIGHO2_12_FULL_42_10]|nr:MAG: diphosphomevalonate decarboxylase [Gammaproteobacteria bacterium RIFCSPHIGHO2_12_FULL_42_10]